MKQPDNYYEICEKANQCRRLWNVAENMPIDILSIVLDKIPNVTVVFLDMEEDLSGSSLKTRDQTIIFVNSHHSLGRQRFTIAHELYHLEYQDEFRHCGLLNSDDEIEEDADNFASCLLMSNGALFNYEVENNISEWNLKDVIQTEQYFQISHKSLLRRLKILGKISEEKYDEYLPNIKQKATELGYSIHLYNPYSEKENLVLGNYIKLIQETYDEGLISKSKREEYLLDAFQEDLIYNKGMDDLIE